MQKIWKYKSHIAILSIVLYFFTMQQAWHFQLVNTNSKAEESTYKPYPFIAITSLFTIHAKPNIHPIQLPVKIWFLSDDFFHLKELKNFSGKHAIIKQLTRVLTSPLLDLICKLQI